MAMTVLGRFARGYDPKSLIAYVIETGDKQAFLGVATQHPQNKESYRHVSNTFADKRDARLWEMADVVRMGVGEAPGSSSRGQGYATVFGSHPHGPRSRTFVPHCDHLTGEALRRCYRKLEALRQAGSLEGIDRAVRS